VKASRIIAKSFFAIRGRETPAHLDKLKTTHGITAADHRNSVWIYVDRQIVEADSRLAEFSMVNHSASGQLFAKVVAKMVAHGEFLRRKNSIKKARLVAGLFLSGRA
jgi:hypothetical protein